MLNEKNERKGRPNGLREDVAAIRLDISIDQLRNMCESGEIKDYKMWYGKYYISEQDIEVYIKNANFQEIIKAIPEKKSGNHKRDLGIILSIVAIIITICIANFQFVYQFIETRIQEMGGLDYLWIQQIDDDVYKVEEQEISVVICKFIGQTDNNNPGIKLSFDQNMADELRDIVTLQETDKIFGIGDISGVEDYANKKNINLVIWGELTSENTIINIYFKGNNNEFQELDKIFEAYALDNNTDATNFYVYDLPSELNFVIFYTIGMIYLSNDDKTNAMNNFELAINELPENYYHSEEAKQYITTYDISSLQKLHNKIQESISREEDHISFETIATAYYYVATIKLLEGATNDEIMPYLLVAKEYDSTDYAIKNSFAWIDIINKNYQDAEEKLLELIDQDENNFMAQNYLGSVYYYQGNYGKAIRKYEKIVEIWPDSPYVYEKLSILYLNLGDIDTAIKYIDSSIEYTPDIAELYYIKSQLLEIKGQYKEALININRAIKYSSISYPAHDYYLTRVGLLIEIGFYNKAYIEEKRLLNIYKAHHELFVYDAFLLAKSGRYDKAIKDLEEIDQYKFNTQVILNSNAWKIISTIDHKNFAKLLQKYSGKYPNGKNTLLFNHIFDTKKMQQEYSQQHGNDLIFKSQTMLLSEEYLDQCNEVNKKICEVYNKGKLEISSEGFTDLQKLIDELPENSEVYLCKASQLINQGELESALMYTKHALELKESVDGYQSSAYINGLLGDHENAEQDIIKAIVMSPHDSYSYTLYGTELGMQSYYEESISAFDTAILLGGDMLCNYINRGISYRYLKEYDNAINDFTKALTITNDENKKIALLQKRAACYMLVRRFDNAVEDIETLNAILPERKEYHLIEVIYGIKYENEDLSFFEDFAAYLEEHKSNNYIYYYYLYNIYTELGMKVEATENYSNYRELVNQ